MFWSCTITEYAKQMCKFSLLVFVHDWSHTCSSLAGLHKQMLALVAFIYLFIVLMLWHYCYSLCLLPVVTSCLCPSTNSSFTWALLSGGFCSLMCAWHFSGEQRCLNSELWHACAGPLVSLPAVGSRVIYFPQGHSEQVRRFYQFVPPIYVMFFKKIR